MRVNHLYAIGVALTLSACALGVRCQSAAMAAVRVSAPEQPPEPKLQERYPRYVIQSQDVLLLSYPLSQEFNQTVTVQPDGFISLLNGANVHVQGLMVPELIAAVKNAYAGTLHDPVVNVDLKDFQAPFFTVSGQVGKPGQYTLRAQLTVAEAIAVAGGLSPTAKSPIFLFRKTPDNMFEVTKLDIKDVLNGKKINEDPMMHAGDMVYVPETFITKFRKYVPYSLGSYISANQSQVF